MYAQLGVARVRNFPCRQDNSQVKATTATPTTPTTNNFILSHFQFSFPFRIFLCKVFFQLLSSNRKGGGETPKAPGFGLAAHWQRANLVREQFWGSLNLTKICAKVLSLLLTCSTWQFLRVSFSSQLFKLIAPQHESVCVCVCVGVEDMQIASALSAVTGLCLFADWSPISPERWQSGRAKQRPGSHSASNRLLGIVPRPHTVALSQAQAQKTANKSLHIACQRSRAFKVPK